MTKGERPWVLIEKLKDTHEISDFTCGSELVDSWLQQRARSSAHLVATYVCLDRGGRVAAFFALRSVVVEVEGFSSALRAGAIEGRAVGTLLAYMGVGKNCQRGHGVALLFEAYRVATENHRRIPVNLFVVDAIDDQLVNWYEANGSLKRISDGRRLALPMRTVAKIVEHIESAGEQSQNRGGRT